jgi:hypothetical protein
MEAVDSTSLQKVKKEARSRKSWSSPSSSHSLTHRPPLPCRDTRPRDTKTQWGGGLLLRRRLTRETRERSEWRIDPSPAPSEQPVSLRLRPSGVRGRGVMRDGIGPLTDPTPVSNSRVGFGLSRTLRWAVLPVRAVPTEHSGLGHDVSSCDICGGVDDGAAVVHTSPGCGFPHVPSAAAGK